MNLRLITRPKLSLRWRNTAPYNTCRQLTTYGSDTISYRASSPSCNIFKAHLIHRCRSQRTRGGNRSIVVGLLYADTARAPMTREERDTTYGEHEWQLDASEVRQPLSVRDFHAIDCIWFAVDAARTRPSHVEPTRMRPTYWVVKRYVVMHRATHVCSMYALCAEGVVVA